MTHDIIANLVHQGGQYVADNADSIAVQIVALATPAAALAGALIRRAWGIDLGKAFGAVAVRVIASAIKSGKGGSNAG